MEANTKPVVDYDSSIFVKEGQPALLVGLSSHPHVPYDADRVVRTMVERVEDSGEFETRNTIYRKKVR